MRADRDEALLVADDNARDRHLVRLLHRVEQQPVGLRGRRVGHEVVRVVVEDRVDLVEIDEVLDLDRARLLGSERVELRRRDDHVAVRADLIALDEPLVRDLLARLRTDAAAAGSARRLTVDLVEAHGLLETALKSLTGMLTRPKLMAPLQIARGMASQRYLRGIPNPPLGMRILRALVVAEPLERGRPQRPRRGPFAVLRLGHEPWLHEDRALRGLAPVEGRLVAAQRLEVAHERVQRGLGEACADLAAVDEPLALHHARGQCAEALAPPALARCPAADHHVLRVDVLHLDPAAERLPGSYGLSSRFATTPSSPSGGWPRAGRCPRRGGRPGCARTAPRARAPRAARGAPRTSAAACSGRRGRGGRRRCT